MAIPGLLVEYLISGALALAWLAPLLRHYGIDVLQDSLLPFLAVALYVVGMVVDFVAFVLVRPVKPLVRSYARRRHGEQGSSQDDGSIARQVMLALHAPDLARELSMRSSRDRIARGAVVNALIAAALGTLIDLYTPPIGAAVWIPLILTLIAMWCVFEGMSYGFELRAERTVNEKRVRDSCKKAATAGP